MAVYYHFMLLLMLRMKVNFDWLLENNDQFTAKQNVNWNQGMTLNEASCMSDLFTVSCIHD